jgi:hypothetical protein
MNQFSIMATLYYLYWNMLFVVQISFSVIFISSGIWRRHSGDDDFSQTLKSSKLCMIGFYYQSMEFYETGIQNWWLGGMHISVHMMTVCVTGPNRSLVIKLGQVLLNFPCNIQIQLTKNTTNQIGLLGTYCVYVLLSDMLTKFSWHPHSCYIF